MSRKDSSSTKAGRISNGAKILFVNPFGIGDVLFTTPLIRPLKEQNNIIYYWCNERVADILKYNRAIEAIFPLSRGDLKRIFKTSTREAIKKIIDLIRNIKKEKFDIALDFSLDYRYSLLLRILGIKKIVGFDYKGRGRFLTDRIKINGFYDKPIADYNRDLLQLLGLDIKKGKIELPLSDEDEKFAADFCTSAGIKKEDIVIGVAVGGGSSFGSIKNKFKRWDIEKFISLIEEIYNSLNAKVIIFWGPGEENLVDKILSSLKKIPIVTPQTSIRQMAAIMKKCNIIVANDAGPLHVAVSQGVKTVSIFGPSDEKVYGPYPPGRDHVIVTKELDCRPCYLAFKVPDCESRRCLEAISPEDVLRAVRSLL